MTGRALTRQGVVRAAAGIAAVTVAARLVGFVRVAVFARAVGPTHLGNTYQTANTLPNVVFEIVAGGALAALVVPVLAGPVERGDVEAVRRTAAGLLTWTVLLLLPITLVGVALRGPLLRALLAGVADPELRRAEVELGSRMLLVFLPQIPLYGVGIVLAGVLQAHRRFLGPALAPLLSSLVVVAAYLSFAAQAGPAADIGRLPGGAELTLSVGTTAGVAVLALSLVVPAVRLGIGVRPVLRLPDGVGPRVRRLAAAGLVTVAVQQAALVVVLVLANPQRGAVVVHAIAHTVFLLPWAVLAVPVATSAFPALSAAYAAGDESTYARTTADALRTVVIVSAVAAGLLAGGAELVTRVVLGAQPAARAAAPDGALAWALVAFAPGLVGYGVVALVGRALYARDRPGAVARATAVGFGVAALADVALVVALRPETRLVAALGAGNSIGMTVAGLLLVWELRRAAGGGACAGLGRATAAGVGAGIVGAGLAALATAVVA